MLATVIHQERCSASRREPKPTGSVWKRQGWMESDFGFSSLPWAPSRSIPQHLGEPGEGTPNTGTSLSHVTCRSINKDTRKPFILLRESIARQRQAPAGQVSPTQVSDGLAEALAWRGGYGDRGATAGEQQQAEEPLQVAMAPRLKQPLPLMQSRPNFLLAAVTEVIWQSHMAGAQHAAEGQAGRDGLAAAGHWHQSWKEGCEPRAAAPVEPHGGR